MNCDRRDTHRQEVQWDALCELGGNTLAGHIVDVSPGGAFFQPDHLEASLLGPAVAGTLCETGDAVILTFSIGPREKAIRKVATLRWRGPRETIASHGFGLAFEEA